MLSWLTSVRISKGFSPTYQNHSFISGLDDVRGHKGHGAESKHSSSGSETSSSGHNNGLQQPQQQRRNRAGRVRTVLTEKQLQLLKSCYLANPRPDALMKEQLVEMTGLSPRVVRVWFQNKRCKDKKKMQMKQSKVRYAPTL